MLRYFFEKRENEDEIKQLFHGLALEQEDVFQTHCGRYPVIFLTFKDVKALQSEAVKSTRCRRTPPRRDQTRNKTRLCVVR